MNKKWKWGLSLASATVLLSGASIGLIACSGKNNNNQQNVEPEKQLYTPPEQVNLGDSLSFNISDDYNVSSPITTGNHPISYNGSCVFQDLTPGSPTYKGWYTLLVNKTIQKYNLCANFIGWKNDTVEDRNGIGDNFNFPSKVVIPSNWSIFDKTGTKIEEVPVKALYLSSSVSDWAAYESPIEDTIGSPVKAYITTSKLDFSSTTLEYINISLITRPNVNNLDIVFPSSLKMLENVDIIYDNTTSDIATTLDFSRCQNPNVNKRQKYPEIIEVDFGVGFDKITHDNALTFRMPKNTPIYFNSRIKVNYNFYESMRTKGIISLDDTSNIKYVENESFYFYNGLNAGSNSISDNAINLNPDCYYYEKSFRNIYTVVTGGIKVGLDGYIIDPQTNNIQPQLQSSIKIDPIK